MRLLPFTFSITIPAARRYRHIQGPKLEEGRLDHLLRFARRCHRFYFLFCCPCSLSLFNSFFQLEPADPSPEFYRAGKTFQKLFTGYPYQGMLYRMLWVTT